jgi:PEGA domain
MNRIMKRLCFFLITILSIIIWSNAYAQAEKPEAALNWLQVLGNVSTVDQQMIYNQLQSQLSERYQLVPKSVFDKALQKMQEDLEADQWSEDQCIRKIQDILQVERLVTLMLLKSGETTQLSLTLVTIDGKFAKSDSCQNCSIEKLLQKVKGLTDNVITQDLGATGVQFARPSGGSSPGITAKIEIIPSKVTGSTSSDVAALIFDTVPTGATVYLGDARFGKTPFQNMNLKPEQQLIMTLKHPDFRDKLVQFTLKGGINKLDPIQLRSKYGRLSVTSKPEGAEVFLAGEKLGITPLFDKRLLSDRYLISVHYPLYKSVENEMIVIEDEKTLEKSYDLDPNFGQIDIETKPEQVSITVLNPKNEPVESIVSPVTIKLIPGSYRLRFEKKGYDPLEFKADVALGKTLTITEDQALLRELVGTLLVSCEPFKEGAEILVDGETVGTIPGNLRLPAGEHKIQVVTDYQIGTQKVVIEDGKTSSLAIALFDKMNPVEVKQAYSSWKWKWWLALGGSMITAYYAYDEHNKAVQADKDRESAVQQMMDADSYEEAEPYDQEITDYTTNIKKHNTNSQLGALVSATLFGFAAWIWWDEPRNPNEVSGLSRPQSRDMNITWYPIVKDNGHASLAWQIKW